MCATSMAIRTHHFTLVNLFLDLFDSPTPHVSYIVCLVVANMVEVKDDGVQFTAVYTAALFPCQDVSLGSLYSYGVLLLNLFLARGTLAVVVRFIRLLARLTPRLIGTLLPVT